MHPLRCTPALSRESPGGQRITVKKGRPGVMTSTTTGDHGRGGNVSGLLRAAAAGFKDRPAVISTGNARSWGDLDRAVDVGTASLRDAGLQVGDRVIVSLQTGPDLIAAMFAVARAGMVAVPIGPGRQDLDAIVDRVGARGAIAGQPTVPVEVVVTPGRVAAWWDQPVRPSEDPAAGGEDIAVLARAATGERPVMVSHRALLAAVSGIVAAPSLKLRAEDRAVVVLPIYHLAGWVTAFLPLCTVGAAAVIPEPAAAGISWLEAVLTTIRSQRVTVVPGAPGLYRRLRNAPGAERALASVRLLTSGASQLDPGDFSAIRAATGLSVWEGYGISESASVVSTGLMTPAARTGSVGLPVPGLKLRIVGDDGDDLYAPAAPDSDGTDAGLDDPAAEVGAGGEVGRIQIGGPTLFSGYWPDGSGGADDQGWFTTGDLGYFDDLGELHLVDRAAETIRVAGFTVYPREIEDVLTSHPYVRDAAVISAPGRAGDGVVAVLVSLWGTHPTSVDLDEFLSARLPVFKRPHSYQLVDRLPRNELGRIDRNAVRALYRAGEQLTAGLSDDGSAELAAEVLAVAPPAVPSGAGGPGSADRPAAPGEKDAERVVPAKVVPDVTPEPAAPLEQLGSRLPKTGERDRRADDDTDDDLF